VSSSSKSTAQPLSDLRRGHLPHPRAPGTFDKRTYTYDAPFRTQEFNLTTGIAPCIMFGSQMDL